MAYRSSCSLGGSPKSWYFAGPFFTVGSSLFLITSYTVVSNGVAIRRCSGAALIKVPAWLSQATMGASFWPFSTAITLAGPLYPCSDFFFRAGSNKLVVRLGLLKSPVISLSRPCAGCSLRQLHETVVLPRFFGSDVPQRQILL